jgi:deazaflavin-dependent oxidoreductase (nitroreductase family)
MTKSTYLPPPWMAAHVGNRFAALFGRRVISRLVVVGRRSGKPRTVPVAVYEHDGHRYLIAPRGDTHWARNLRAAGAGRLVHRGKSRPFTATEVPVADRPALIAGYRKRFGRFPMVGKTFEALSDPADHPTFLISERAERETRASR